jgi:regulator of sigma E protease
MTIILSIFVFILILGILIFVHELGHFLSAKAFGVKVNEFGLGLPPRAWGIKRGETIYSLNWIPVGGFVSIFGEDDPTVAKPGSFGSLDRFRRSVILLAGVGMNFLLAVAIFSFIFAQGVEVPTNRVRIDSVAPDSPAQAVGLKKGDLLVSILGEKITDYAGFQKEVRSHLGTPIDLVIERDGAATSLQITPRANPPAGQGALGVVLKVDTEKRAYSWYQAPVEGTKYALGRLLEILILLAGIITGNGGAADQVTGPVGIAYVTYRVVQINPGYLLEMTALISLSLALMNVLPLPALDGGRLAFVALSALFRRNFYPKLERYIHQVGLLFFLLLFVLITYNDLTRVITTTSLGSKVHEIFKTFP